MEPTTQKTFEDEHLSYSVLPNGIHEFIFKKPTTEALAGVFAQLEKLYAELPENATVLELIDGGSGSMPISKAMRLTKDFVHDMADWPNVRTAVLYQDNLTLTVVQPFIQLLRMRKFAIQFFKVEHRDRAIEWLLKGK
jgi:hypothetical protein